ncbi:hypothetical protein [Salinarimonas ramus]|uniref:Lipoprotein n=1 Tax=Salinarimonas ramus TaxID=690164 RepID=A0A917Q9B4_9HYPH|nr:hypothetical protein [Salinarimonas ramus]GGK37908.1 hypothetical protein GCM10011322_26190 [Salinarimonas ramus]
MGRFSTIAAAAAVLATLAACGQADRDAARLCRLTLPVLNPDGAEIAVLRAVAPEDDLVRVDYTVEIGGRSRQRWALCRFAHDPIRGGRTELVALETDEGPVTGASLYLMRRFWLETPDAQAADPGAG